MPILFFIYVVMFSPFLFFLYDASGSVNIFISSFSWFFIFFILFFILIRGSYSIKVNKDKVYIYEFPNVYVYDFNDIERIDVFYKKIVISIKDGSKVEHSQLFSPRYFMSGVDNLPKSILFSINKKD